MRKRHVAFIVEAAHGHINPTLPIASSLLRRAFRVSYATTEYFSARVKSVGAEARVYRSLENKHSWFRKVRNKGAGEFLFDFTQGDVEELVQLRDAEEYNALTQLRRLYDGDKPDLVIYDRTNLAGLSLAKAWRIQTAEHCPLPIHEFYGLEHHPNLVLVSIPTFFQKNAEELEPRFHFVGPLFNDGRFFAPWKSEFETNNRVFVSATTGFEPEIDYFKTAIRAFADSPFRVVLSIGSDLNEQQLPDLPDNFEVNRFSSHQQILQKCRLCVCQAGSSTIFEALRFGVPLVVNPPSQVHDINALRVVELGLGVRLTKKEFTPEALRKVAESILSDRAMSCRVADIQKEIAGLDGAESAAQIIEQYMVDNPPDPEYTA